MSINKSLSRRTFLKGIGGVCVALPALELTHGKAWAQTSSNAKRFVTFFSHGGTINCRARNSGSRFLPSASSSQHGLNYWAPVSSPGANELSVGPIMQPLAELGLTEDLLVLESVSNFAALSHESGMQGGHGISNVTALTASDYVKVPVAGRSDTEVLALGTSIDQVLAQRLQARDPKPFASLDLMIKGSSYGSPFFNETNTRIIGEFDPRVKFDALFGHLTSEDAENARAAREAARLRFQKKSVLDGVLEGFNLFRKRLGQADRISLDAHANHIREMERRLSALDEVSAGCVAPDFAGLPAQGLVDNSELVAELHVDLILHALRCDLTSVANLQIPDLLLTSQARPYSSRSQGFGGHGLGHAGREVGSSGTDFEDWRTEILANRQWRMGLFARLMKGLKDTPEGDGNMLDNSVLMYTSEFSYAGVHCAHDVPMLLAGKAGGRWRTNRSINYNLEDTNRDPTAYRTETSNHNVYCSVLNAFGETDNRFGNDLAPRQGPLDLS